MMEDRYGLALSTRSPEARDAYVSGLDRLLALQAGVEPALRAALAADPDFALAHVALGRWLQMTGQGAAAREAFATAGALAAHATQRERGQAEVFARIGAGDAAGALEAARAHLAGHPRDALVLSTCASVFGLIGFSGRPDREAVQLALLEALAPHYRDDWWFPAMHAFALIETGYLGAGLAMAEGALAAAPHNANAAHVLAHALYETGDDARALDFLGGWLPGYPRESPLCCHLWWHAALSELAGGRTGRAAEILAEQVLPAASRSLPINTYTDGVSLLWRTSLAGAETDPQAWQAVRAFGERHWPKPGVFVDVHAALALAGGGDHAALERYADALEQADAQGRLVAGPVVPRLARAASAFVSHDDARTIALLEPVLDEVVRIGGSRAQRDLVLQMLLAACLRAGRAAGVDAVRARRPALVPPRPTPAP
jgi:hypothetical protein